MLRGFYAVLDFYDAVPGLVEAIIDQNVAAV